MFSVCLNFSGHVGYAEQGGEPERFATEAEAEAVALRWRRFFARCEYTQGSDCTAFVVGPVGVLDWEDIPC